MKITRPQLRRIIRESLQLEMTSHERETGLPSEFVEDNWLPWLDERGLGADDLDDLARFTGAPDRSWLPVAPPADGMDGPADLELWARNKRMESKRTIREALSTEVPDIRPRRRSSFQVRKEKELASRSRRGSNPSNPYDNITLMNKAIMDAIFDEPLSEKTILRVAQTAAPGADKNEILDFIDELENKGTIEWNADIQMYDLP